MNIYDDCDCSGMVDFPIKVSLCRSMDIWPYLNDILIINLLLNLIKLNPIIQFYKWMTPKKNIRFTQKLATYDMVSIGYCINQNYA